MIKGHLFVALYEGRGVGDGKLVASSCNPELVSACLQVMPLDNHLNDEVKKRLYERELLKEHTRLKGVLAQLLGSYESNVRMWNEIYRHMGMKPEEVHEIEAKLEERK